MQNEFLIVKFLSIQKNRSINSNFASICLQNLLNTTCLGQALNYRMIFNTHSQYIYVLFAFSVLNITFKILFHKKKNRERNVKTTLATTTKTAIRGVPQSKKYKHG